MGVYSGCMRRDRPSTDGWSSLPHIGETQQSPWHLLNGRYSETIRSGKCNLILSDHVGTSEMLMSRTETHYAAIGLGNAENFQSPMHDTQM